jgi:aspartyl-tRNA synthetase
MVSRVLGALRLQLGRELELIDTDSQRFLWVTDFPMFEWDPELERWDAVHHPFTRPNEQGEALLDTDPGAAKAIAYDLVANGIEIAGGSFRIHEAELQAKVFGLLDITPEEQRSKFGFLLDALAMGAPRTADRSARPPSDGAPRRAVHPRARCVPEEPAGVDPMSGAPTPVEKPQLDELGIAVVVEEP